MLPDQPKCWKSVRRHSKGNKKANNYSKIVDANGEPKAVWHGAPKGGFTIFNTNPKGKTEGIGAWFASDRSNAVTYSGRNYVKFDTPSTLEDLYYLIENNEAYRE